MNEPDRIFEVPVLMPNGERVAGEFQIWEQSPENAEELLVVLRFLGQVYQASSKEHFFEALTMIRRQLEPQGIIPDCFGCSRNVYPSPMSLSMGPGKIAFRMEMGQPAEWESRVTIFEAGPDTEPLTVEEQERSYWEWLGSLGRSGGAG